MRFHRSVLFGSGMAFPVRELHSYCTLGQCYSVVKLSDRAWKLLVTWV